MAGQRRSGEPTLLSKTKQGLIKKAIQTINQPFTSKDLADATGMTSRECGHVLRGFNDSLVREEVPRAYGVRWQYWVRQDD